MKITKELKKIFMHTNMIISLVIERFSRFILVSSISFDVGMSDTRLAAAGHISKMHLQTRGAFVSYRKGKLQILHKI